jgi:tRNA pseudouridine38-40 synthase
MNYFLHIGYDGSHFRGWQWQPNAVSVQETIEQKLKIIFKTDITVFGCGRTDAGVHASQYMMHITLPEPFDFDLKFRLNKNLPDSIVVYELWEMDNTCHSRFDVTSRTYDYFIHSHNAPVLGKYSSYYDLTGFDFEAMKQAALLIGRYNDCKALCIQPHLYKHTRCEITHSQLYVNEAQQRMRFSITANRFLRGMVRICVSFILKVGAGQLTLQEFEHILANQIIVPNKRPAFPNGLYLSRVEFPYIKLTAQTDMCSFLKVGLENEA